MSQYFFKISVSSQHWGEVHTTKDVKLRDLLSVSRALTSKQHRGEMLPCVRLAVVSALGVQLWCDTSWGQSWRIPSGAAVWHGKAWLRDGWRAQETWSSFFKLCIMSVFHGLRLKAAASNERKGIKKGWQMPATCIQSKDKMLRTRKQSCISKLHSSTKPARCELAHFCHWGDWIY